MPRMTRKNVLLGGLGLLLLAGVVVFMLQHEHLRRAAYLRMRMHEAAPGVFVKDGLPAAQEREFLDLAAAGRARAAAWFGPLRNRTVIVFAHDLATKGELGIEQPFAWNPIEEGNARLYIGPRGLSVDLLAHGIAHAEIKERVGLAAWPALPAWFDEGIATQVDWRPYLQPAALPATEGRGAEALRALADHAPFRGATGEENLAVAKAEVVRWLAAAGGVAAFDALATALRAGEPFEAVYARLERAEAQ